MLYDMIVQASSKTKHNQLTDCLRMTSVPEDENFASSKPNQYSFMAKAKDLNFGGHCKIAPIGQFLLFVL
jgi:hypothetical protein